MSTLDVITLDEALEALNITDFGQDAELPGYISAISRLLDRQVGPIVVRTIANELVDGANGLICLRYYPVSSITSVIEHDGSQATVLAPESYTATTDHDYLVDYGTGVLYRRSSGRDARFPSGRFNVVVTYEAGRYATTADVDARFKAAAKKTLEHWWRAEQGASGATFGAPTSFSPVPGYAIPNWVLETLGDELQAPVVA